jgi:hypothetical protein
MMTALHVVGMSDETGRYIGFVSFIMCLLGSAVICKGVAGLTIGMKP